MAAPYCIWAQAGHFQSTAGATTTHTFSLPSSNINANDLLCVAVGSWYTRDVTGVADDSATSTTWTELNSGTYNSSTDNPNGWLFVKVANGDEESSTVTITTLITGSVAWYAWIVRGCPNGTSDVVSDFVDTNGVDTNTTVDPPSVSLGSTLDALGVTVCHSTDYNQFADKPDASEAPSGWYDNFSNSGATVTDSEQHSSVAGVTKRFTAVSSINPGQWSVGISEFLCGWTIGFKGDSTSVDGVPIQEVSDTSARTGATTTVTISSADGWATPASGNYLVAMVSARNDSGGALTFTTPSGFTAGPTDTSGTTQAAVFYKTSGGTETSTDFAVGDGGGTLVNMNATMIEISATGLTGLDGTAEDTSDVSSADTATPSGTVNATTPPGLAVAMIGTYRQDLRDGTPTWSNSYVSQAYTNAGQTARAGVAIATKVLTATGNTNTTYTTTDSATAYGALLVYNGTSTVGPIIQFHKLNNGF